MAVSKIGPRKTDLRVPIAAGLMDPSVDDNHAALIHEGNGHVIVIDFDAGTRLLGDNEHRSIGDLLDIKWDRYATPVIDPSDRDKFWIKMHRGKGIGSITTKITPMGIRLNADHIVKSLGFELPIGTSVKIPTFWDDNVWGIMLEISEITGRAAKTFGSWPGIKEFSLRADLKKGVVLVIDASGSFLREFPGDDSGQGAIEVVKKQVISSIVTASRHVAIGLVAFHREGWSSAEPSVSRNEIFKEIHGIVADGPTMIGEALERSQEFLRNLALNHRVEKYEIVVVTDGMIDTDLVERSVRDIRSSTPIGIHILGIDMKTEDIEQLPEGMSCETVNSPDDLLKALNRALS